MTVSSPGIDLQVRCHVKRSHAMAVVPFANAMMSFPLQQSDSSDPGCEGEGFADESASVQGWPLQVLRAVRGADGTRGFAACVEVSRSSAEVLVV